MARLRLFIVFLLLAVAYVAQITLDHGSLRFFVPAWAQERLPWLFDLTLLRSEDLLMAAGWALAFSVLLIGLLLPAWYSPASEPRHRTDPADVPSPSRHPLLATAGVIGVIGVGALLAVGVEEQRWMALVWGGANVLVAIDVWRNHAIAARQSPRAADAIAEREGGWIGVLIILLLTALLAGWHWTNLPVRIDVATARFGMQMSALDAAAFSLFGPGETGVPGLAYLPGRSFLWLLHDGLQASHVLGMVGALAAVVGTWLVGRELFRRPSLHSGKHIMLDDGRRAALLAAGLTGTALSTLHFGRLAPFLPATALGLLACWQLLYSVRRVDLRAGCLAGAMAAGSLILERSGLVFLLIALLWWAGFALVGTVDEPERRRQFLRQFGWWTTGAVVVLAPVVGTWLHEPIALQTYLTAVDLYSPATPSSVHFWNNLFSTVSGIFWSGDASPVLGIPVPLLSPLVTPLFMGGLALLLFSLDQLTSWCLLTGSIAVLIVSTATNAITPDWPTLLPAVPVAGLIIALAADRLRLLILQGFGAWTALTSFYIAAGLLIAVAAANWTTYWAFAQIDGDDVSYLAHALRASDETAALVQVASSRDSLIAAQHVTLRFAAGAKAARMANLTVAELEPTAVSNTQFFVLPTDGAALEAVRTRFPRGTLSLERDLYGNPRLWVYGVP